MGEVKEEDPVAAGALRCPVRACGEALLPLPAGWGCIRGHRFDRARAGYTNLLQPQDRRSLAAGDRPEATRARERLVARGVGLELLEGLSALAVQLVEAGARRPARVLEVGTGHGALLGRIAARLWTGGWCVGLELSTYAAERAARNARGACVFVANADRRLPFADGALDLVVSVAGPKQPAEFARVLAPGALALVAVPGPRDLLELREALHGSADEPHRADAAARAFGPWFSARDPIPLQEVAPGRPEVIEDLLAASYRGARHSESERVPQLHLDQVTLALDAMVFRRLP